MSIHVEKKCRTSSRCLTRSEASNGQHWLNFESLPPEVLELVMRFLPYSEIANQMRLVSRKCCSVSTTILNSAFLSSVQRTRRVMEHLERASKDATDGELRLGARNGLELVLHQCSLLRAVVWRYTHPPSSSSQFERHCFYAGSILDDLDAILRQALSSPADLCVKDDSGQPIGKFTAACKKFMNYFEKVTERKINKSSLISGCKSVDILDCLLEGREVRQVRISRRSGAVTMRIRYVLSRAWFTCLEVPLGGNVDENSWRDRQRFMYLRLRRLIGSFNEHYLEKVHYDRECQLLKDANAQLPMPKPPPCSTYSGYGEYGGSFFYYGNMNEFAYESKVVDAWRRTTALRDRNNKRLAIKKPNYDLVIDVELRCSPDLAPLAIRSTLKCDDIEYLDESEAESSNPEMYLRMSVNCPASKLNRLPSHFDWELRSPSEPKTTRRTRSRS
ncbi:hypothetical protein TKK_0015896 [Trichogramma kaykai]|uniref:F-box domain-containing protein n=1 Tax=Trichogramma kaykai TaxID=54128 RepID=A0ABD2W8D9_9HYME